MSLQGKVIDEETKAPLPYATLLMLSLKTGTIANVNGEFVISINSQNVTLDSMEFSFLGYNGKKISIKDFLELNEKTVKLSANPVTLNEIVVIPKKYRTVKTGITDKKRQGGFCNWTEYNMLGNFFLNSEEKPGYIKSVSFYICKDGIPTTPFRIRIFDLDKEKMCPGNDILTQNVVVAAKKPGWFKVDLIDYNVPFQLDGVFLFMEWINSGDKPINKEETVTGEKVEESYIHDWENCGQYLGVVMKSEGITWKTTIGNQWILDKENTRFPYKGLYPTAMIKAEVMFPKD